MHRQLISIEDLAALGQIEGASRAEETADGADESTEGSASSLAAI